MFEDQLFLDEDPYKGWNRAAIMFRSRKNYKPNVRAEDLLMPSGFGNLRMLGMCIAMGFCMTLLYVWIPLFIFRIFVPFNGPAYSAVLGGAVVGWTLFLYIMGTRETRRDRELGARL